ncbi:MAG TPA: DNA primase [Thermoanaerobaculia bacterium]|jgi:DNA primase catalytic core|nr:DNA primase [Thermoanaerobaculia bacterium]
MSLGNVHITPQLVQAVRDAVDVVSIASEHTKLRKAGRRYQGLCPMHKEKTPSFSVDPVAGLFYCFGCGAGGDAIKLHMLATGDDFPAAIEALAGRYGIPLPSRETRAGGRTERDLEGALQAASEFFRDQLRKSSFAKEYLEKRKIPPELIERFGLGYAPDGWRNLIPALQARVPLADLEAAGLVARSDKGGEPYDRFRNRLIFPIHNPSGRLVGFGGRTLGDDQAKYVNSNETDRFHKGLLLYGLHHAKREIRESGRAVLCEGYFDVIGSVACGLEGSIAGMGTALTPEQAKQLSRYAEEVVVAYDGDNAGENAFRRALPLLLAEGLGVRRARFPAGHDPDSLRIEAGSEAVEAAVRDAEDAVVAEIERLVPPEAGREPQLQAKAATAVTELLRPIPDPILRFSYARIAAERLGVPVEMLSRRIGGTQQRDEQPAQTPRSPVKSDGLSWNIEKLVLALLLEATEPVPPFEDLPQPEAFLDPECRNIYQVYCALYAGGVGSPPDARAVLSEIGSEGGTVDQMAGILLERNITSGRLGLLESLEKLEDRWRKQRSRELAGKIREAELRKDSVRLQSLLEEKSRLSQHRGFRWSREGI